MLLRDATLAHEEPPDAARAAGIGGKLVESTIKHLGEGRIARARPEE